MGRVRNATQRGFTLLELIVVMMIIVILAAIIVPMVGQSVDDAKTAKAVELVRRLGESCGRYYMDTNEFPREWSSSTAGWNNSNYSRLTANNGVPNWDGPYLDAALHDGDNPFGINQIRMFQTINTDHTHHHASWPNPNGFDLTGDDGENVTTNGCVLCIWGANENPQATNLDRAIDGTLTGPPWYRAGKVEWGDAVAGNRHLSILVFHR